MGMFDTEKAVALTEQECAAAIEVVGLQNQLVELEMQSVYFRVIQTGRLCFQLVLLGKRLLNLYLCAGKLGFVGGQIVLGRFQFRGMGVLSPQSCPRQTRSTGPYGTRWRASFSNIPM